MTDHSLAGRKEQEVLWAQRRSFLIAAAAWTTAGGTYAAQARSNVVDLRGDATVNGERLTAERIIQSSDRIVTGPGSTLTFTLGNSAFHVRQNSSVSLDPSDSGLLVSALRLFTGAVVSVWGKGEKRKIVMPTLTAGIRGTGVYAEVFADQGGRSYLCNCYGEVEVNAGEDQTLSRSEYHQAFWGEVDAPAGRKLLPAKAFNHTDEELETLARLAGQQTAWQITGRKGVKNRYDY